MPDHVAHYPSHGIARRYPPTTVVDLILYAVPAFILLLVI